MEHGLFNSRVEKLEKQMLSAEHTANDARESQALINLATNQKLEQLSINAQQVAELKA